MSTRNRKTLHAAYTIARSYTDAKTRAKTADELVRELVLHWHRPGRLGHRNCADVGVVLVLDPSETSGTRCRGTRDVGVLAHYWVVSA